MSGPHTGQPAGGHRPAAEIAQHPGDFGHTADRRCTRQTEGHLMCLGAFAAGYCLATDLCGPCTARLMVGLDWVTGLDLPWHQSYNDRAGQ